ncbi:MAG: DUF3999 family protein [Campylobacteraceae bacterium]
MKIFKKLGLLTLLASSIFASETPNNFAYGYDIELLDKSAALSKIDLYEDIYLNSYSKKLDDLRVFNRDGNLVTFSLNEVKTRQNISQKVNSSVFLAKNNEDMIERQKDAKAVDLNDYEYTYILKFSNKTDTQAPLISLKFAFENALYNWEANVDSIYVTKPNTKEQILIGENLPLKRLSDMNNANFIDLDTVLLDYYYISRDSQEELVSVKLSSKTKLPKLVAVEGVYEVFEEAPNYFDFKAKVKSSSKDEIVYELNSSQPISKLTINQKDRNSIVLISIFYKSNENDKEWKKLHEKVLSSVGKKRLIRHF